MQINTLPSAHAQSVIIGNNSFKCKFFFFNGNKTHNTNSTICKILCLTFISEFCLLYLSILESAALETNKQKITNKSMIRSRKNLIFKCVDVTFASKIKTMVSLTINDINSKCGYAFIRELYVFCIIMLRLWLFVSEDYGF